MSVLRTLIITFSSRECRAGKADGLAAAEKCSAVDLDTACLQSQAAYSMLSGRLSHSGE